MIVFDLVCGQAHVFEAWFGSSVDYDAQQQRGLLSCPLCGDPAIEKAVMAPAVAPKGNQRPARPPADNALLAQLLRHQRALEEASEYVGERFAEEARALHAAGDQRSIYGETTLAEAVTMHEEGIPLVPLPFRPRIRSDA